MLSFPSYRTKTALLRTTTSRRLHARTPPSAPSRHARWAVLADNRTRRIMASLRRASRRRAGYLQRSTAPTTHRAMSPTHIEDFRISDLDALVRMWRESFEYGVGITDPNLLEDQMAYF